MNPMDAAAMDTPEGYSKWGITLKNFYTINGKRKSWIFKKRSIDEVFGFIFDGAPDEEDNLYAVNSDRISRDNIPMARDDIEHQDDVSKIVGPLEDVVGEVYMYFEKDRAWPSGLYRIDSWQLNLNDDDDDDDEDDMA